MKKYQKDKYDTNEAFKEGKKEYQKEYEKDKYDTNEAFKEGKKEYYNKKYQEDLKFRKRRQAYFKNYYREQDKILKLITQNFENHDSGMDICCVSCLRLHNRQNVTKYKNGKNEENDAKLLLTEKTLHFGHYYLCRTCRPGLIKGFPGLD